MKIDLRSLIILWCVLAILRGCIIYAIAYFAGYTGNSFEAMIKRAVLVANIKKVLGIKNVGD